LLFSLAKFNQLKFRPLTQLMTVMSSDYWRGSGTLQFWTWTDENTPVFFILLSLDLHLPSPSYDIHPNPATMFQLPLNHFHSLHNFFQMGCCTSTPKDDQNAVKKPTKFHPRRKVQSSTTSTLLSTDRLLLLIFQSNYLEDNI